MDFDRIAYWRSPSRRQHVAIKTDSMPYVEIVPMYGGADTYLIKAALDHGVKGVWVANGDIVALLREAALMARSFHSSRRNPAVTIDVTSWGRFHCVAFT